MAREKSARRYRSRLVPAVILFCLGAGVPAHFGHAAERALLQLAQSGQNGLSAAEQQLQVAIEARRAADFERAREVLVGLERRLGRNHPLRRQVLDELYFQLPLAVAQKAMTNGEIALAESKIDEAERYLAGHPGRGELSQVLERYRRALWMAK